MRNKYRITLNLNHPDGVMDVMLREDWDRHILEEQERRRAEYQEQHPEIDASSMHFGEIICGITLCELDIEAYNLEQAQRIAVMLAKEYYKSNQQEVLRLHNMRVEVKL